MSPTAMLRAAFSRSCEVRVPRWHARGRGLVLLQRFGAKEPARSRRLTPRRLWRRGSCDGPRYEIFTLGSEHRNGGLGLTAVDVRNASGAWRAP